MTERVCVNIAYSIPYNILILGDRVEFKYILIKSTKPELKKKKKKIISTFN